MTNNNNIQDNVTLSDMPLESDTTDNNNKENETPPKKKKQLLSILQEIIGGSWISTWIFSGNILFLIFVALLAITYISNRFASEDTKRQIETTKKEIEELRTESVSVSAALMTISRESEVYKLIQEKGLGLEILKTPPYKIVVFRPP